MISMSYFLLKEKVLHTYSSLQKQSLKGCQELLFQREGCPSKLCQLKGNVTNSCSGGLTFLEKFGCREPALSSLEELRISNFPKLQLLDRCALFWNISDNLQKGKSYLMKVPLH